MTKEEAIKVITSRDIFDADLIYEAVSMAIKALEQEAMRDATPEERESVDKYIKSISKPTRADFWNLKQEPKTGHWKIIPFSNNHGEYRPNKYACSECGWTIDLCRGLQQDTGHRLFCEHCGAKMIK